MQFKINGLLLALGHADAHGPRKKDRTTSLARRSVITRGVGKLVTVASDIGDI